MIYTVIIWNFTESSHKQNKDVRCKVSSEWLLTVSKLPLCMSSIGGRKRSARVLSFLSTVPPLRSSCSWRTRKRTFKVVIGSQDTVQNVKTDCLVGCNYAALSYTIFVTDRIIKSLESLNLLTCLCLEVSETIKYGSSWSSSLWHCTYNRHIKSHIQQMTETTQSVTTI